MVGQSPGRTFISYSRKDGAQFAAWLRTWLEQRNLSVWQDIVALEGGRDWWSQIEEALKSKALQHFILVVTPASLASPVVRREIRLARQEGKTACPVKGPGLGDLGTLPRWLGQIYDLDLVENQTTLIRVLEADSRQKRVPMMAPEPPNDFVARPKEFGTLKRQLLDAKGDAVAGITAALKGAGGYGKTTLAKKLAHDPDIQDAYFDGILWAVLGEKPERLLSILIDQIELLTGERPGLETINAAAGKLGEALGDRRILLIADDVWREQDLRPFLQGGPNCVRLVTTRIDSVLPQNAVRQKVDSMKAGEALVLLSSGLQLDPATRERASMQKLAARLGEWAVLLKIVNSFLRDRVNANEPLSAALNDFTEQLDDEGLFTFDPRDGADRARALARTINLSLELLSESERERFSELAIFPEDIEIPVGVGARLWAAKGAVKEYRTKALLSRLFDLSLLLDLDFGQGFFRLHDTTRHFLRDRAGKESLVEQHMQLVAALDTLASQETDARTRRYFYLYFPHHLAEAGKREKLDALLLDPGWLKAKLDVTASPYALFSDYQLYGSGEPQSLIGRTLRLISGICARDGRQLPVQLATRLACLENASLAAFTEAARRQIPRPAIVPFRPSLTPPGAETARFEGHKGAVSALLVLADGRLASGSTDGTIRLWDTATGVETAGFKGHYAVTALCALADGRLASSGYWDGTIRLYDVAIGLESARVSVHRSPVNALCLLPDGRLASSSTKTIRLWEGKTGTKTARFRGHNSIYALCALPDGRLASGSYDGVIQLWDASTGTETMRLEGHGQRIQALCVLKDGRLVSASWDGTIRMWDVAIGTETTRIKGRSWDAICPLPDGGLAFGGSDSSIRLWDAATGRETVRLEGHTGNIYALCLLADGRLVSGSGDATIRLWDIATRTGAARRNKEHGSSISAVYLLPNGRLVSTGSSDKTIRLWDAATGTETAQSEGHTGGVAALCHLADGRLASGSYDKTIRLWDTTTAAETARLELNYSVVALCLLMDGRLASGTDPGSISLWNVAARAQTTNLLGPDGAVSSLCHTAEGWLAWGSYSSLPPDNSVSLWHEETGAWKSLVGHNGAVTALCLAANGTLASASWDATIRLWDVAKCVELACLDV
jgi:WD40 repeat protein